MSAKFSIEGSGAGAVKAVEQLQKELDATGKNAEVAVKSTKALEAAAKSLAAQADPQERYNQRMAKLIEAAKAGGLEIKHAETMAAKYGAQLERASDSGEKTFGSAALGKIVAFAGGVATITAAFKQVEDQAQAAADSVLNALATAGELQQLGPEAFARGAGNARKIQRTGTVKDITQGFEIAQNLENAGFSDQDIDYLVENVLKQRIVSASNLTQVGTALAKFQTAFGEAETGPMTDVVDKAMFVATIPGVSSGFSETITETLKYADSFKRMGGTDEEALATFAAIERVSPSSRNAAEVIKSFVSQVNARELGKGNLQDTLDYVQGLVERAGGNAAKVLGDANAVAGFNRISANEEFIMEQAGAIGRAQGTLKANAGLLSSDPVLGAANVRAIEEGNRDADIELFEARKENLFEAAFAAQRARESRNGTNALQRYFNYTADRIVDAFGGENFLLRGALREHERDPSFMKPETAAEVEKYLADIAANTAAAAKNTAEAAKKNWKAGTRPHER